MSRIACSAVTIAVAFLAPSAWAEGPAPTPTVPGSQPGGAATPPATVEAAPGGTIVVAPGSQRPTPAAASGPAVAARPTVPDPCASTVLPMASERCPKAGRRAVALRVGRVLVETVLGLALGTVLAAGGAYGGLNFDLATSGEAGVGMGAGTALGLGLGGATGVYLGGLSLRGDGSFGWTLLGSTVGTGLAAGLVAIDNGPGMLATAATLSVACAVVSYELSSHARRPRASPAKVARRIVPILGTNSIGLAGVF